jgi:hypothetical protein
VVLRENSKDKNSAITDRLLYVRNPWGIDTFDGTYSKEEDFTIDQYR